MDEKTTGGLTSVEEEQIIALLGKVTQPWSAAFYNALAPHVAMTANEVVVMRETERSLEVFLVPRSQEDKYYPGQLHSPGSMFRTSDAPEELDTPGDFKRAFERVQLEINRAFVRWPEYVGRFPHRTPRGVEIADVSIAEIRGEPVRGAFYPVDALPRLGEMIEHHRAIIAFAAKHWRATRPRS